MRGGYRVLGDFEVLRPHIAGAKGNDAQPYARTGHSLDHVKDRAIAAADNKRVITLGNGPLRLGAGRAVLASLHCVDRDSRLAEDTGNASNISPPCSSSLKHRVDEEQDLSHEKFIEGGTLELSRLFPIREDKFLQGLPLTRRDLHLVKVVGQACGVTEVAYGGDRANIIVGGNGKRCAQLFRIEAGHRMGVQSVCSCRQGEIRKGRAGVMQVKAIGSGLGGEGLLGDGKYQHRGAPGPGLIKSTKALNIFW